VQGRSPWLSPRAVEKIDKESYHEASRRETEKEKERETERRRENTLAGARLHGVTRKYDAPKASRRGTKRPRRLNPEFSRALLGGSTRNTLLSSSSPRRYHLFPIPPFLFLLSLIPLATALCSPDRAALFAKACRTFAKGVPHTGPHRSPRYLSRQISWLRCTPCNA